LLRMHPHCWISFWSLIDLLWGTSIHAMENDKDNSKNGSEMKTDLQFEIEIFHKVLQSSLIAFRCLGFHWDESKFSVSFHLSYYLVQVYHNTFSFYCTTTVRIPYLGLLYALHMTNLTPTFIESCLLYFSMENSLTALTASTVFSTLDYLILREYSNFFSFSFFITPHVHWDRILAPF
jgi:hypothetical protein